jgi:hypothetical protein
MNERASCLTKESPTAAILLQLTGCAGGGFQWRHNREEQVRAEAALGLGVTPEPPRCEGRAGL